MEKRQQLESILPWYRRKEAL